MAADFNSLVLKVRRLQGMVEDKLEQSSLVRDLKKYAQAQQKVLKKRINSNSDLKRMLGYIEKRRRDLDKVAKNLPKEVATMKKYVAAQRSELEKMGKRLIKDLAAANGASTGKSKAKRKKPAAKRARTRRSSVSL